MSKRIRALLAAACAVFSAGTAQAAIDCIAPPALVAPLSYTDKCPGESGFPKDVRAGGRDVYIKLPTTRKCPASLTVTGAKNIRITGGHFVQGVASLATITIRNLSAAATEPSGTIFIDGVNIDVNGKTADAIRTYNYKGNFVLQNANVRGTNGDIVHAQNGGPLASLTMQNITAITGLQGLFAPYRLSTGHGTRKVTLDRVQFAYDPNFSKSPLRLLYMGSADNSTDRVPDQGSTFSSVFLDGLFWKQAFYKASYAEPAPSTTCSTYATEHKVTGNVCQGPPAEGDFAPVELVGLNYNRDNFCLPSSQGSEEAISIIAYGATANDTTDDTTAIQNAISAAGSQGKSVYVPAGTFRYRTFRIDGVTVIGAGSSSVLYAPDQSSSMVILNGAAPELRKLRVQVNGTFRTGADHAIFVEGATQFVIDEVEITGSASAAILTYGSASNGKITNNYIHDTWSDGIHNTDSAHDIIVAGNTVRATGDDMIAVVSYDPATAPVRNILIKNNDVSGNTWGRGISVVGGQDVTIEGNTIGRTPCCAGIIVASEQSFDTAGVSNVLVRNNTLSNNSGDTNHGAFMLSGLNPGTNIDRVRFEGNTITEPVNAAISLEGNYSNAALINNTMADTEGNAFTISGGTNKYCSGNTMNGSEVTPSLCTGSLNFTVTGSSLVYGP